MYVYMYKLTLELVFVDGENSDMSRNKKDKHILTRAVVSE